MLNFRTPLYTITNLMLCTEDDSALKLRSLLAMFNLLSPFNNYQFNAIYTVDNSLHIYSPLSLLAPIFLNPFSPCLFS